MLNLVLNIKNPGNDIPGFQIMVLKFCDLAKEYSPYLQN